MEKVIKGREASITVKKGGGRPKGCVACRDGNGIASGEREEETWGKGTFEVHVMLRLREGGEERVKMRSAHNNCNNNGKLKKEREERIDGNNITLAG